MGLGGKIMAGIAVVVAAMVVKRYMKKREKEDEKPNNRHELMMSKAITAIRHIEPPQSHNLAELMVVMWSFVKTIWRLQDTIR
jgi:membrane protein implicated in regulation of membrane protease activity